MLPTLRRKYPRTVALSFSRIKDFQTCPKQFHGKHIQKVPQGTTEAMARGSAVHKAIENYIKGTTDVKTIPRGAEVAGLIDSLRAQGLTIQAEVGANFTASWSPIADKWSKDVWFRQVIDVLGTGKDEAVILDWKTGKRRFDPKQLQIFATGAFLTNPKLERVTTGFVWLDQIDPPDIVEYGPTVVQETIDDIECVADEVERSKIRDEWDTRPGQHCRWCPLKGVCPDAE